MSKITRCPRCSGLLVMDGDDIRCIQCGFREQPPIGYYPVKDREEKNPRGEKGWYWIR